MKYYVYMHYKADTLELFYIGKGCGYRSGSHRSRSPWWKAIVAKHGLIHNIALFFETEREALDSEKILIASFREMGYNLCNLSGGGDGAGEGNKNLLGHKHSEETKKKIGAARKGHKQTDKQKEAAASANKTRVWSEESRKKASESAIRRRANEKTLCI